MSEQDLALGEPVKADGDLFAKVADPRLDDWRRAEQEGLLPFYRELDGEVGPSVTLDGRRMVMLGSNNYLGLTTDERVRRAATDAVGKFGTGVTGSRLLNGTLSLHRELEAELADWVGAEAALVFTTGYTANLGLLSALVGPGDAAVLDSAAHASLVDGARFAEGALRAFRHNRPNSLRRTLRSWREQPDSGGLLVAIDGIYSMEGDWAPIPEVAALCREYGARLLVDEAHSLGVVGPGGAGTAAATGVKPDLFMGTFSKSLASCGGFIAGPAAVIDFLKITCRPLLFTAAGVPAALAAALAAVRIARREDWRRESVAARARQLRRGLDELGYDVGPPVESAIVAVHVEEVWEAGLLWKSLLEHGVYTNCAIPPAVPRSVLRTSVMATHTEEDIDRALDAFAAVKAGR
ncbi:pyridoxal phosphate-dependent aminotransferase family protein [Acidiferrimicrobium sp. IK]|uniref:aminotransferase class I/II-fold pyridoxal phosphate-dependent enzyme n=1 Tax=Acidiferrimicrobium sp. IK TaxID=2871700 RepID=UPI0021CAF928|nr:pyridoxal phosphate-dependent aminotransferase family protein [Acidiferrimicrobium sp. IK]MCU4184356.1 pyridoxal phosphate-dependent aminotransferase family protein [Acidiferrimicrobium sp. IK]